MKAGRPSIPLEERRIVVSLTLPYKMVQMLKTLDNKSHFVENAIKKEVKRMKRRKDHE